MKLLRHPRFFWVICGFLALQALWIALSNRYPMAFDEDFHFGIIKIYSHHLSPFLYGQPAGADSFGPVARDPSYLYHYLMSFPYRLIAAITNSQSIQVIFLRLINIALFVGDLWLIRRVMLRIAAPITAINASLLVFVLIPVVPMLAGQINYDNLFIGVIAAAILLTERFIYGLEKRRFDVLALLLLAAAVLLGSLVKYAFLPIALVLGLSVVWNLIRYWRRSTKLLLPARPLLIGGALLVVIASGIFSQRYLVNVARYGTPLPDCAKVLTIKQCSRYGPWNRDYNLKLAKADSDKDASLTEFTGKWFYGMWMRLYFTLDGPRSDFQTRGPLPVPALGGIAIAATGLLVVVIGGRKLLRAYDRRLVATVVLVAGAYIAVLFLDNFAAFRRTGQPVAINGRYLLPFLPYLGLLAIMAGREVLHSKTRLAYVLAGLLLFSQLYGGGAMTFILRSEDGWYWQNRAVVDTNHAIKIVFRRLTPGYNNTIEFLR